MDILESLFSLKEGNGCNDDDVIDEDGSGSENDENGDDASVASVKPVVVASRKRKVPGAIIPGSIVTTSYSAPSVSMRRNRPERGKFTILDGIDVAAPEEILDIDFTPDLLQKIFQDSRIGIQFLARYGIIPNTRECRIETCPKEQLMSLIKHANGYVWRCRSCRKRRERRVITKISVYEGTFLFYSRMPLNKFFIFMLIWCENPGCTVQEYNRLLGEFRLVEETIHNTIGFIRDHIQSWCSLQSSKFPIGGDGQIVELLETHHTDEVSSKHRNRRARHFTLRLVLIDLKTNDIVIAELPANQYSHERLYDTITSHVNEGSTIVMRDSLMHKFGEQEQLQELFGTRFSIKTIADVWEELDWDEKDRQYVKTMMECVPSSPNEPFAYEYYFRRTFMQRPFNQLLKAIRELYAK